MRKSPNDTSGIIWALGEFFFSFMFFDTNLSFITYIGLKSMKYVTRRGMEGDDDKKGPKCKGPNDVRHDAQ